MVKARMGLSASLGKLLENRTGGAQRRTGNPHQARDKHWPDEQHSAEHGAATGQHDRRTALEHRHDEQGQPGDEEDGREPSGASGRWPCERPTWVRGVAPLGTDPDDTADRQPGRLRVTVRLRTIPPVASTRRA